MPTLLEERVVTLEFSDLFSRRPLFRAEPPRTKGVHHQSAILAHIARKVGWLKPNELTEDEYPWRWALGKMWEEFWFSTQTGTDYQPGEVQVDGIVSTADGITADGWGHEHDGGCPAISDYEDDEVLSDYQECTCGGGYRDVIEETKCTEEKLPSDDAGNLIPLGLDFLLQNLRMHQGREYGHAYFPGQDVVVRWTILYYRGNWRGSGPVCKQYVVRFSAKECRQTHEMLVRYKGEVEVER